MTVSEFWHLKYGTIVENPSDFGWGWKGVVVRREVHDEVCGFIMSKRNTCDIKTGRKYLEITFETENGSRYYVQSDNPAKIKKLVIQNGGCNENDRCI